MRFLIPKSLTSFTLASFRQQQQVLLPTTPATGNISSLSSILFRNNNIPSSQRLFSNKQSNIGDNNMSTEKKVVDESSIEKQENSNAVSCYDKPSSDDNAGPDTVFDNILSGKWSSQKVYEDEKAFAFRDINPQAPVHILVIPKVRDGLVQLSKARSDQKELLGHLLYVAQEVGKKECPNGFRIVINDGKEGQQTVFHLHLHVIGGRQLSWPPG